MRKQLNKLVKDEYLWGYQITNTEVILRYGLASVKDTERVIDIQNTNLKQALLNSAKELRTDIESSLVDDEDFYGYDSAEQLEERIVEETEYLELLSSLV